MVKGLIVHQEMKHSFIKKEIHSLVGALCKELKFEIESIELNFVDQETILGINKEFLSHDFTTDIITFNYSDKSNNLEGEIYISVDDALANSKKYKVSLENEITRLVIHGILHLLGYDDISVEDKKIMKKKEDFLVSKYEHIIKKRMISYGG